MRFTDAPSPQNDVPGDILQAQHVGECPGAAAAGQRNVFDVVRPGPEDRTLRVCGFKLTPRVGRDAAVRVMDV